MNSSRHTVIWSHGGPGGKRDKTMFSGFQASPEFSSGQSCRDWALAVGKDWYSQSIPYWCLRGGCHGLRLASALRAYGSGAFKGGEGPSSADLRKRRYAEQNKRADAYIEELDEVNQARLAASAQSLHDWALARKHGLVSFATRSSMTSDDCVSWWIHPFSQMLSEILVEFLPSEVSYRGI